MKFKESCFVNFAAHDLIEFDYLNFYGKTTHWKVETLQIYFDKEWLMVGVDLDSGDELSFMMKYMGNVKYY